MNTNPFEGESLDEVDAGEAWSDELDDDAFAEGAPGHLDEGDAFESGAEAEGFEDDAFDEDGFDDEDEFAEDPLDDDDSSPTSFDDADSDADGLEAEGLDEADELDEDEADELDDAFAEAMDAADEDEFVRRLSSRMRLRLRTAARPFLRRMAARAVPIGLQLIRHVSRMQMATGPTKLDAMDAFADAAADEAISRAQMNLYIPFLAGLAGRYVTKSILSASRRSSNPAAARAIGRAVTKATRKAAKAIVHRHGAKAIRSVPKLVRQVVRVARQQPGVARKVPTMIQRAAKRVAVSRPAAARLSRPSPAVRRVVARAGIGTRKGSVGSAGRSRSGPLRVVPRRSGGGGGGGGGRTIHVHGPVRIVTHQASVSPRRPL